MNYNEIIAAANEAGIDTYPEWLHGVPTVALKRFAEAIAARERDALQARTASEFVEHQRELSRALDQRDELLKALNQIAVAAEATVSNPYWIAKHARAAIAKVKGGAA